MANITTVGKVKQALGHSADSVSKTTAGTVMVRKGYFYRNSRSAESYAASVADRLKATGVNFRIENIGDKWAPFRGNKGVAANSHFYVELTVFEE